MTKIDILKRLDQRGAPLFDHFPKVPPVRIQGLDCELGVPNNESGEPVDINTLGTPIITDNGGQFIIDCEHLEYGTPECANTVELVAYQCAMLVMAHGLRFPPLLLHHNNHDFKGETFGCHASFCTRAGRDKWPGMLPFLVASLLLNGSGRQNTGGSFEISQRASRMNSGLGHDTPSGRSYITTRDDRHCTIKEWDRMHLIYGDSHMIELNSFMVYGFTSLVIEMMEMGALPDVRYDLKTECCDDSAVADGISISQNLSGHWLLKGVSKGPKDAIELLRLFRGRAAELFQGRDEVTDVLLIVLEETLNRLEKDPMTLFGWLDWVTKYDLITRFKLSRNGDCPHVRLEDVDLEYHNIDPDPDKSWYHYLVKGQYVKRVVSNGMIKQAIINPPAYTRAFVRGKTAQMMRRYHGKRWKPHSTKGECWKEIWYEHALGKDLKFDIGDPFCTYAEYIPLLEEDIQRLGN